MSASKSTTPGGPIVRVSGPALVLPGDDLDTDRIMPARFLRAITFEGLEAHLFEDERREASARGLTHPFDDAARRGARVLIVGRNFGCGSSREHAPQAIARWGIQAIVGESFAEIFFGNAVMLGMPCVTMSRTDLASLGALAASDAAIEITVDLQGQMVTAGGRTFAAAMPETARRALMTGAWDATALLLADYDEVRRTALGLPYIAGF